MTFYYHFQDIYDLAEWVCIEDGREALKGKKTYDTWQEGMTQVFGAVLENKPFIMNIYHTVRRERLENYLYKLSYKLIADVVEEKCAGGNISEEDKKFIADFYKYGFVGVMLNWIDHGMISFLSSRIFVAMHPRKVCYLSPTRLLKRCYVFDKIFFEIKSSVFIRYFSTINIRIDRMIWL